MGMVKIIAPDSQAFDEPTIQIIKSASGGISGNDLKSLIKRAGHRFADSFKKLKLEDGDIPVHQIAIGASGPYPPNRNGDYFGIDVCRQYHPTFVKYAKVYRDHQNKNPDKSYGFVKFSDYNDNMHRIELLVVLNGNKKAASRNGGLVADEELNELEKKGNYPVSMSCFVSSDICSICGNKAKTRKEYCTGVDEGGMCKGGGLKNNITAVLDDGRQVCAINPDPKFFDISRVRRGADRIAFALGQMKSANHGAISGAQLAETLGIKAPFNVLAENNPVFGILIKLSEKESELEKSGVHPNNLSFVKNADVHNWDDHGSNFSHLFNALVKEKIILPVEAFLQLTGEQVKAAAVSKTVKNLLPGIYTRMIEENSIPEDNPFEVEKVFPSLKAREWVIKKAADYSLEPEAVNKRIIQAALYTNVIPEVKGKSFVKVAGVAEELARTYALYKLATLKALMPDDNNFDLTIDLSIRQNYL